MSIKFRTMTKDDKDEVLDMMRTFYNSPAVHTNGTERIYLRDFNSCVSDFPYLDGFIIESCGAVCGYSMVARSYSTEFGKLCMWVEDLYLKESSRGLGIAGLFFDYLDNVYPDVIFRLEVEKENTAAVNLYQKKGYSAVPYLEMIK